MASHWKEWNAKNENLNLDKYIFRPFQGSLSEERSGGLDIEHDTLTSEYQEVNHYLQGENLILQHESPIQIDFISHPRSLGSWIVEQYSWHTILSSNAFYSNK